MNPSEAVETTVRPAHYKRWHRWQWGWQKWLAFTDLIETLWPRNNA